jgi:hypothetical protein
MVRFEQFELFPLFEFSSREIRLFLNNGQSSKDEKEGSGCNVIKHFFS